MSQGKRQWDPWQMYDVTTEERRAIKDRSKMRESLKAEWVKKFTNPWKSAHDGGFLYDPAVQRFMAMKATQAEYFKGTFRTGAIAFFTLIVPVAFLSYQITTKRDERERRYRNGEVMYKDRHDKFFS